MIKAFFISSHELSDSSRAYGIRHCQLLANRHGLCVSSITRHNLHITLIADNDQDLADIGGQDVEIVLGRTGAHPHTWDRFLRFEITATGLVVETDYVGSIPVFYSLRGGFAISNIEPCVYLASESTLNDISYENLYGFLRYSHFIWDETAWKHISQILPDSRYTFSPAGQLVTEVNLGTVRSSESRCGFSDKQVGDELFELNRTLVRRPLADADDIVLLLTSA